jgi:PhnB protein
MAMIPFNPARPGYTTLSPLMVVEDMEQELQFLRNVFQPEITDSVKTQLDGRHELKIGNTTLFLIAASRELPARKGSILVYVKNIRETFDRVSGAGAVIRRELTERFNGDFEFAFEDPGGNYWICAKFDKLVNQEGMIARYQASQQNQ